MTLRALILAVAVAVAAWPAVAEGPWADSVLEYHAGRRRC